MRQDCIGFSIELYQGSVHTFYTNIAKMSITKCCITQNYYFYNSYGCDGVVDDAQPGRKLASGNYCEPARMAGEYVRTQEPRSIIRH
jgi:hypothetical protein